MDAVDYQLVIALHESPLASLETLGSKVGLTGSGVKQRLDRLHREGVLQGFAVLPLAECFGRNRVICHFDPPAPRFEDLERVPDVVWAKRDHHGGMTLLLAPADADTLPVELKSVFKGQAHDATVLARPGQQKCVLGKLEWRILRAWLPQPRQSLAALAKTAGLSTSATRRRRDKLLKDGLVEVFPLIDTSRHPGTILYGLAIKTADVPTRERVIQDLQAHREAYPVARMADPPGAYLWGHATTFVEVERLQEELAGMEDVQRHHLTIPAGMHFARDRMLGWIDEQLIFWSSKVEPR